MTPRVSVSVPIYNGADHLAETIESVLAQTFEDFELVLIDDASADASVEIARSYRDPRIRVIENAHQLGPEGNWNAALSESLGEYVKVISHDDIVYPECLAKQVEVLDEHDDVAWVTSRRDIIDGDSQTMVRGRGLAGLEGRLESDVALARLVRSGTNIFGEGASVLMRKDAAVAAGGFDGRRGYVIDLDLWVRMLFEAPAYAIDESLATFRVSKGQWSVRLARQQARQVRELLAEVRARPDVTVGPISAAVGWVRAGLIAWLRRAVYVWLRFRGR